MAGGAYLSAEVQSMYFTAPADWAIMLYEFEHGFITTEATKNIGCVKVGGTFDPITVTRRFKKFLSVCKKPK